MEREGTGVGLLEPVWSPVRDDGVPSRHNEEQVWMVPADINK